MFNAVARLLGLSLAILALGSLSAAAALAGGGDPPTGPGFSLGAPTAAVDRAGQVVLTFDFTCSGRALDEAAVLDISTSVSQRHGQGSIGGGGSVAVACAPGNQSVNLVVAGIGKGFHPGPVTAWVEFHGCDSVTCGQAAGDFDLVARAAR